MKLDSSHNISTQKPYLESSNCSIVPVSIIPIKSANHWTQDMLCIMRVSIEADKGVVTMVVAPKEGQDSNIVR